MAQKFVGIDLGNRKVKIAVITAGLRGAQLVHVWEQGIEVDAARSKVEGGDPIDPAVDLALRMIEERGLGHLPTGVALPGGSGSYRVLSFPFDDPRQIAQAVNFAVDGQFPLPNEELAIDHLAIKRGDGRGRALVVAAKRTTIEHVVARLQLADIDIRMVTTGAMAIAQALATNPVPPLPAGASADLEPVSLLLDLGKTTTELVALGKEGPVAVRSLRRGGRQLIRELKRAWNLDVAAATAALERDGTVDDPLIRKALQPLLREVEHTRQWLRSEVGCQVVEIRLSGGGAKLRGFAAWLGGETKLDVGPAQPRESGALRGVQGREWGGALVALGAALATGRRPLIQLHDVYDMGGGEGQWFQQHFSTVAALGVAILAFAAVDSMVRVRAAERERDAYVTELEYESTQVFGAAVMTSNAIRLELAVAEGGDMKSHIPERGALETLELLTKASLPKGGRTPPVDLSAGLPPGYTLSQTSDGSTVVIGPDGATVPIDASGNPILPMDPTGFVPGTDPGAPLPGAEGEPVVALAPVADRNAGVLADDELVFSTVDIRELKISMNLSATRVTAQDRFAVRLERLACVQSITKGAIRDRNDRKTFEMTIDHNCYTGSTAIEGQDAEAPVEEELEGEELEGQDGTSPTADKGGEAGE